MGLKEMLKRLAKVVAILIIIAVFAIGCGRGQSQTGIWTKFSDMQLPPDIELTNPWTAEGIFKKYLVYRGVLRFQTGGTSTGLFIHPEERFDNEVGSTAEVRMKLLGESKTGHEINVFLLQDGSLEGKVLFFNDRIEIYDQNDLEATYKMDTTDRFHTYRLAIAKHSLEVYVDGGRVSSVTLNNPVSNKMVLFGDASEREGEDINAQIDYIAYSVKGAMAPWREAIK
ncbi:hypothetical protein ACFLU9_01150, partial [Chloroflexota bacterium]